MAAAVQRIAIEAARDGEEFIDAFEDRTGDPGPVQMPNGKSRQKKGPSEPLAKLSGADNWRHCMRRTGLGMFDFGGGGNFSANLDSQLRCFSRCRI
jgi:hypothetical protein